MDETESPRQPDMVRDVLAIALAAVTLMLIVSFVTRNPADPLDSPIWPISFFYTPDSSVYPINHTITNACGYWGALLSAALIDAIGLATIVVIGGLGGIATALLIRGRLNAPVLRSLGGTVIVLSVATGAALVPAAAQGMPVVGNGGYLGAMTSTWLLEHFAPGGAWILTLTALTIGLLLTTDYALLYAGRVIATKSAKVSRGGIQRAVSAMPLQRRRRPFTDLDEPIRIAGEEGGEMDPAGSVTDPKRRRSEPTIKAPRSARQALRELAQAAGALAASNPSTANAAAAADQQLVGDADDLESDDYDDQDDLLTSTSAGDIGQDDEYGEYESGDDEADTEDAEPVAETPRRELQTETETVQLRGDQSHPISTPKIKTPKRKTGVDPRQELFDNVNESIPEDVDQYRLPSLELLEQSDVISYDDQERDAARTSQLLEETFRSFGFNIAVTHIQLGPVITQYELELEAGLRLSKITGLADDLAIALRVPSVRIVAPIPGKNTVGIEVPNEVRQVVRLRDVIEESNTSAAKMNIPVFLGQDVSGNPMVVDLAKMPHLLIAGRTGTGKSVCLNAIISSILMCCRPDEVRMLMIDPKMVELSGYGRLPHLMHPVITDMKKAEAILAWAVEKMEERYSLLAKVGVRHINSFNDLGREEIMRRLEVDEADGDVNVPEKLPFIVIVADEMADLMMTAGKDVEQHIIRLAQKSRAVGIHLILATQKPTVDVITGLIKSNLPARLSFQVASKTDSRVVLDENGADKLLGNGDMLFLWPGTSTLIRGQGTYLSDDEIDAICEHCSMSEQNFVGELMNLKIAADDESGGTASMDKIKSRDELYDSAIEVVIREGRGSCSLLQRCLGIGYGRAAKLIDFMAEDGIVGEYNGSKAREVTMTMAQWQALQGIEVDEEAEETPAHRRRDKTAEEYDPEEEDEEEDEEEEEEDEDEEEEEESDEEQDGDELDEDELDGAEYQEEYEDYEEV
jgi:S-DNA-T family DNA segregation ATPase FtsK/SpoIIIE